MTSAKILTGTCKVLVEDLAKSEPGDITVACLCGGLGNHSILVKA